MTNEKRKNKESLSPELQVVKSNRLINAHYSLSALEQKIILTICSKIKSDDITFKVFELNISEFISLLGDSENVGGKNYANIRKACRKLATRIIEIETDDEGFLMFPLIYQLEYKKKTAKILIQFNPELAPYLLFVRNNIYTKYRLGTVLQFRSRFSIRIYELMKQYYPRIKERTISLDELKKMLGIEPDEYPNYGDFKRSILEKSKKELQEKSDIEFSYSEVKRGRKVVSICFSISENFNFRLPVDSWDEYQKYKSMSINELSEIFCDILKEKYNAVIPIDVVCEYTHYSLLSTIFELKEGYYKNYDIQKPTRYFLTVLENKSEQKN